MLELARRQSQDIRTRLEREGITLIDGTGALLVADDAGNAIWRVTAAAPAGGVPPPSATRTPPP